MMYLPALLLALFALDSAGASVGEMVAEHHRWYGSAAAMIVPESHEKLSAPKQATQE